MSKLNRYHVLCVLLLAFCAAPAPAAFAQEDALFFTQATVAAHGGGEHHGLPCIATLNDGRLLLVWSRYPDKADDFAVMGAFSADCGCSWTSPQVLIDHPGLVDADANIVVDGVRVLVTCTTVSFEKGIHTSATWSIRSEDNGNTWTPPYEIPMNHRYTCGKCQRAIRLKSGALLMGYSWDAGCEQGATLQSEGQMDLRAGVMRSEDGGLTWANGGDTNATYEKIGGGSVSGTDEPAIVELDDGSLYMLMRTGSTHLYEARSTDEGRTWTDVGPSPLRGTNAPASMVRFSHEGKTGILAVWDHGVERLPLCATASFDGGRTWSRPRDIGYPYRGGQASYPSAEVAPDGTFIVAWQQDLRADTAGRDIRIARFSPAWLLAPKSESPTIVLFGDSVTAARGPLKGYGAWLREGLLARGVHAEILNAGIGGHATDDGRGRFERDVLTRCPDIAVIMFGINDAAADVWRDVTEPRITLARYEENLRFFVTTLRAQGVVPVLMTPNPLAWTDQEKRLYGKPPYDVNTADGHNVLLREYVAAVRNVAQAESVPLVDVYAAFAAYIAEHPFQNVLLDGIHPNDAGHKLITDLLLPEIARTLESLPAEAIQP